MREEASEPGGVKLVLFYAVCLIVSAAGYAALQAWAGVGYVTEADEVVGACVDP